MLHLKINGDSIIRHPNVINDLHTIFLAQKGSRPQETVLQYRQG